MTERRDTASDTWPLIILGELSDCYWFIRLFYDEILIAQAVLNELTQGQFLSPQVIVGAGLSRGLFPPLYTQSLSDGVALGGNGVEIFYGMSR